jgi:GNAT superfamily N-acetyltransferase
MLLYMTTTAAVVTYEVKRYAAHDDLNHTWTIYGPDGTTISALYVDMVTCEVRSIETHPDHRWQGHATALWNAATQMFPVRHSHQAHRTDEGSAWASAVGGDAAPCTDDCDCNGAATWRDAYTEDEEAA